MLGDADPNTEDQVPLITDGFVVVAEANILCAPEDGVVVDVKALGVVGVALPNIDDCVVAEVGDPKTDCVVVVAAPKTDACVVGVAPNTGDVVEAPNTDVGDDGADVVVAPKAGV